MNYENYASINNSLNPTQKNWCISLSKKPVKQVSVVLSDGRKFPYVSRFNIDADNVVIIGKEYAYEISALHADANTTGLFGVVSDVCEKITVKKSELVELDMVFSDECDKKALTACGKYIALAPDETNLQYGKEIETVYPITFMIRKILASASILANQKLAGAALVETAKEYIASKQYIAPETLELCRAAPEYVDVALWDIYVANKKRCDMELEGEPRYKYECLYGFDPLPPTASDKTQDFVHKSVHIGAISVMVRGGFANLLSAYLDSNPPILDFKDEIIQNIGNVGYPELIKILLEYLS